MLGALSAPRDLPSSCTILSSLQTRSHLVTKLTVAGSQELGQLRNLLEQDKGNALCACTARLRAHSQLNVVRT